MGWGLSRLARDGEVGLPEEGAPATGSEKVPLQRGGTPARGATPSTA
jgi:hypothetical protein